MAIDEKLLREDAEVNAAFPAKPGGPLVRRMSQEALQRVIRAEGPEVMTAAADSYWKDQDKRFPHLQARATNERRVFNGIGAGRRGDANPRRLRLVNGRWMVKTGAGRWKEEPAKQLTAVLYWPNNGTLMAQCDGTKEELEKRVRADDDIWNRYPIAWEMHDPITPTFNGNSLRIRHNPPATRETDA